jgi:phage head maturation protease
MRSGALDGLSIGFRTVRASKDAGSGVRRILEADLWEISVVTFPMLPEARIDRVKGTGPAGSMARLRQDIARRLAGEAAALRQADLAERFRRAAKDIKQEDRIA